MRTDKNAVCKLARLRAEKKYERDQAEQRGRLQPGESEYAMRSDRIHEAGEITPQFARRSPQALAAITAIPQVSSRAIQMEPALIAQPRA